MFFALAPFFCSAQVGWQWGKNNNPPFDGLVEAAPTALDFQGNVFVGGEFTSNFDNLVFGSDTLAAFDDEVFVVKTDPSGNFLWAFATQNSESFITSIATDSRGNLLVLGQYYDSTCTVGPYTLGNDTPGTTMYFLFKLTSFGSVLWATNVTLGVSSIGAVCIDYADNVYVTGSFSAPSVIIGTTTLNNAAVDGGTQDLFIAKYNKAGAFEWAHGYGGLGEDVPVGLCSSPDNAMCLLGTFTSAVLTLGGISLNDSLFDAIAFGDTVQYPFFAKLDTNGNILWARDLNPNF